MYRPSIYESVILIIILKILMGVGCSHDSHQVEEDAEQGLSHHKNDLENDMGNGTKGNKIPSKEELKFLLKQ